MIQDRSIITITDNTGAQIGRVFKILGSTKKRYAEIGDLIVFSVQKAQPRKAVKKKDVLIGIVVRQKKPFRRKDGSYIRFDENSVVCVTIGKTVEPTANRVFGPIPREIGELGYQSIVSLAPEII